MRPVRNNNYQKRKSRFFDQIIGRSGEDFLVNNKENPVSLGRYSNTFFKDLANGNFDLEAHGQYLSNGYLLSVMIQQAYIKLGYYMVHCKALPVLLEHHPEVNDDAVQRAIKFDYDSLTTYNIIHTNLMEVFNTGNLGFITVTANQLKHTRYVLI